MKEKLGWWGERNIALSRDGAGGEREKWVGLRYS